jgi:hypothetical protein
LRQYAASGKNIKELKDKNAAFGRHIQKSMAIHAFDNDYLPFGM